MYKQIEEKIQNHQAQPLGQRQTYAVLLPLVKVDDNWQVLYQVRSQHIPQPGEVAFPGGKVEKGEGLAEAAIRETCEELNIQPNLIDLIGEIDYLVFQERTIHCFVGRLKVENWQDIQPNEEVAELFTIPLNKLMATEPTYYQLTSQTRVDSDFPFDLIPNGANYPFSGQSRSIPFYEGFPHTLWGMTALFTHHFCQLIGKNEN